ncbi:pentapeptide repeat-containing protein [Aerosakkonemataceae cyanobacterium BLCC-F50]|uniref:Pentapeptide repeat-containing protein n=1 Tax=Floridaenema flaviceps BLCC-F50 TaxID=3153642 RepID=A0ABV4Y281_9CYAN
MDAKDSAAIVREIFAHLQEQEGLHFNHSNWYIGVTSDIESRPGNHIARSKEHSCIVLRAIKVEDARSAQQYFLSLDDYDGDKEVTDQGGIYVYAYIKMPSKRRVKGSRFSGIEVSAEEILEYYEAGERNFSEARLKNISLDNVTLTDINLQGAMISHINLINVDLRAANFQSARIVDVNVTKVNLNKANLNNVQIQGTQLSQINLTAASLRKATLAFVRNIDNSDLTDANLEEIYVESSKMSNCCLIRANLSGADLRELYLNNSNLTEANLSNANLTFDSEFPLGKSRKLSDTELVNAIITKYSSRHVFFHNTVMPDGSTWSS